MKNLLIVLAVFSSLNLVSQDKVTVDDIDVMLGEKWAGDLVYLDYSSSNEVKIPVTLSVEKLKEGLYSFKYEYPEEPKANSKSKVSFDLEDMSIAKDPIDKVVKKDGLLRIITIGSGKDGGKKAKFIKTYVIGSKTLIIRKDVQYEGSDVAFMRNEYRLNR